MSTVHTPSAKRETLKFPFGRVQELRYREILAGIGPPVIDERRRHDDGQS